MIQKAIGAVERLLQPEQGERSDALDPLAEEDAIDSRIGVHDKNRFEVKLDYAIDPSRRKSHYRVDAYFFVPKSLGINGSSYTRDQFYADAQAYIRFKTPRLPLFSLLDATNHASPLKRIAEVVPKALAKPHNRHHRWRLRHELQMLGCLVRAHVRDRVADTRAAVKTLGDHAEERVVLVDDLRTAVRTLIAEVKQAMARFRELRAAFLRPQMPQPVREAYEYTDEYLSLVVESHLTALIDEIDGREGLRRAIDDTRQEVAAVALAERRYRKGAGYPSVLHDDGPNEHYVYRQGVLKKFVMSVLFLEISKEPEGRRLGHVVGAIAAATAMLFAAIATLWSQSVYAQNSMAFVLALVISYVFKDRIKDGIKLYFSGKASRWLYDYSVNIRDPENDVIVGRCRETFSFVDPKRVPREVLTRRHADARVTIEPESKPELVMHYGKDVKISNAVISRCHGRVQDINDIIRFNVSSFLVRMDDAVRAVRKYSEDTDTVVERSCPKTYHLNVVLVLQAYGRAERTATIERVRVVLDKNGIRRLEVA